MADFEAFGQEQIEQALLKAVVQSGTMVQGPAVRAAWPLVHDTLAMPKELSQGRWERALAPSLKSGAVKLLRIGRFLYWGPSDLPDLPLPDRTKRPRSFGDALEGRARSAEEAVVHAVNRRGALVTGREVMASFRSLSGNASAPAGESCIRILEPAIAVGRVIPVRVGNLVYYGPAGRHDLQVPSVYDRSDLAAVEEGLRRAVTAESFPVRAERVAAELVTAGRSLRTSSVSVAHHLGTLVKTKRALRIRPARVNGQGYNYYSTIDGPKVLPIKHHLDLRFEAAKRLWKAGHGRPFTTKALRAFAAEQPTLRLTDDEPWGWTNGLKYLADVGALTSLRIPGRRAVLWAPAKDWSALSPQEQERRLADGYRKVVHATHEVTGVLSDTTPRDVNFVSANDNMRTLVLSAKQAAAYASGTDAAADLLLKRPVTSAQVSAAAEKYGHLLAGLGSLRLALFEASRLRAGMRRSAIIRVGCVGRTSYYDVEETASGQAFVRFLTVLRGIERSRLLMRLDDLERAHALAEVGVVGLPRAALAARVAKLAAEAEHRIVDLQALLRCADLLPDEQAQALSMIAGLVEAKSRATDLALDSDPDVLESCPVETALDIRVAWDQIASVADFELTSPRLLVNKVGVRVRKSQPPDVIASVPGQTRKTRRVVNYLDRVSFGAETMLRWGGAFFATFASTALHALGDLRDALPFIRALESMAEPRAQAAAAAALGILDDDCSRSALAGFLEHQAHACREGIRSVNVPAVSFAVYGLARKPAGGLASTLSPVERDALTGIAEAFDGEWVGGVARRVVQAWDEEWSVRQLLQL